MTSTAEYSLGSFLGAAHSSMRQLPEFHTHATRWLSAAGRARAGGDWCEIVNLSDDLVALTIGDVCGHEHSAAPTMTVMRAAACNAVRDTPAPAAILTSLNELVYNSGSGITVTAIIAFIDRRRRTLTFASAGHPAPFLMAGDAASYLAHSPGDLPLGIVARYHCAEYMIAIPERRAVGPLHRRHD